MIAKWVTWSCFLAAGSLSAESIGNVDFQLPKDNGGWKMVDEMKNQSEKVKATTEFYVPANATKEETKEIFVAHENNLPMGAMDQASLEKVIQNQFPNEKVNVKVLDSNPTSVLYEWSNSDNGVEKVHRWTRAIASKEGTVMLTYQTQQMDQVDKLGPTWKKVLQDAKAK